eukprot:scaffold2519_cov108-Isochrysis_galbana.AAC.4
MRRRDGQEGRGTDSAGGAKECNTKGCGSAAAVTDDCLRAFLVGVPAGCQSLAATPASILARSWSTSASSRSCARACALSASMDALIASHSSSTGRVAGRPPADPGRCRGRGGAAACGLLVYRITSPDAKACEQMRQSFRSGSISAPPAPITGFSWCTRAGSPDPTWA